MELVFFYGTLMTPFNRTGRLRIDEQLELVAVAAGVIAHCAFRVLRLRRSERDLLRFRRLPLLARRPPSKSSMSGLDTERAFTVVNPSSSEISRASA